MKLAKNFARPMVFERPFVTPSVQMFSADLQVHVLEKSIKLQTFT